MDVVFTISRTKVGFTLLSLSRSVLSIFSILYFQIFRTFSFNTYLTCFWSRYVV
jgi:hypothetical protein